MVIDTTNSGIPSNLASAILIDQDSNLWIGTNNKGIGMFDGNTWTYYHTSNTPTLKTDYITDIKQHTNGDMWFGTNLGIAVLSANNWTFYDTTVIRYYPDNYQLYIQFDSKGDAYTISQSEGTSSNKVIYIYKYSSGAWQLLHTDSTIFPARTSPFPIPKDFIIDQNDDLWIKNGYFFNGTNWNQTAISSNFKGNTFVKSGIALGKNNNKWFYLPYDNGGEAIVEHDGNSIVQDFSSSFNDLSTGYVAYDAVSQTTWINSDNYVGWNSGSNWKTSAQLDSALNLSHSIFANGTGIKKIAFDQGGNAWMALNQSDDIDPKVPIAEHKGLVVFNDYGIDSTHILSNIIDQVLGINQLTSEEDYITIFPNPAQEYIEINGLENGDRIALFSQNGKLIKEQTHTSSNTHTTFQLSSLQQGTYIVNIQGKNHSISERIVVQK